MGIEEIQGAPCNHRDTDAGDRDGGGKGVWMNVAR